MTVFFVCSNNSVLIQSISLLRAAYCGPFRCDTNSNRLQIFIGFSEAKLILVVCLILLPRERVSAGVQYNLRNSHFLNLLTVWYDAENPSELMLPSVINLISIALFSDVKEIALLYTPDSLVMNCLETPSQISTPSLFACVLKELNVTMTFLPDGTLIFQRQQALSG